MNQPEISSVSPFFIVQDVAAALWFDRDQLGFDITYREPADDPFFSIGRRGGAMTMLKSRRLFVNLPGRALKRTVRQFKAIKES